MADELGTVNKKLIGFSSLGYDRSAPASLHHQFILYSQAKVPLEAGFFYIAVFRAPAKNKTDEPFEFICISKEKFKIEAEDHSHVSLELVDEDKYRESGLLVRVHSECFTGEVLGSLKCDCKSQLESALEAIEREQSGMVIYLKQEGRGIGLGNKIKAYHLQNKGFDTVDANLELGFANDLRDFSFVSEFLTQVGIHKIRLLTNNPEKIKALSTLNLSVTKVLPAKGIVNEFNKEYLKTKNKRLGHNIITNGK